ncbi:pilus assembly protein [Vibrio hannami]|uniref:TadE/TadG family type IV pilus assembly protein n=1 Tax=Vibrio hannami TaxID=2717094 RepID=UPI00240F2715|nr:TadE family protein [Vibrio hannami]MDG3087332.1 pilus assembly protein [Vibrio hannami]
MAIRRRLTRYKGIAIVEFTIVATALLIILFGIFEIGRFVYSVQMLNEVTRKVARLAAVCHVSDQNNIMGMAEIKNTLPAGVSSADVVVEYLDESGAIVADPMGSFGDISFVRARITNINYTFLNVLESFNSESNLIPNFETTVPAENLGVLRYSSKADDYTDCI